MIHRSAVEAIRWGLGRGFKSRARNHLPANSPLCHEPTSSGRAARCQFTSPALPGKRANLKSATRFARGSEELRVAAPGH